MTASSAASPASTSTAHFLDRTGVFASVACAVHCMVAPLLVVAAPVVGGLWVHPATHLAIAALVLPVAAFALRRGYRLHGRRLVVAAGALGMVLVLVGVLLPFLVSSGAAGAAHAAADGVCRDCCPTLHTDAATGALTLRVPPASIVTLLGGIALVAAHVGNLRCCATCGN